MDAAARVVRHESDRGRWELVSRAPHERLRGYVGAYQGYDESGSPAPLRQQVPAPLVPIIVNFGSRWHVADSATGPPVAYNSFVAGLGRRSSYVAAAGAASCVQVNVTPLGAHMLFGLAMHELADEVVSLEDALPRSLGRLADELEDLPSWEERFARLDATLSERLDAARTPSPDVTWAWSILERTYGRAPLGWICDRLGRSRRHLAARFREQVGLPPKTVARIMRFDRAVSLLGRADANLADVAFECGYFDQAHLSREFREFAGTSPAAFVRRMTADGGVIL
jgi:AraC-like DNA-binding protein